MKKLGRLVTARKQWDYCSCAPQHICADMSLAVTEWTLKTKLCQMSSPHPPFAVVSPECASEAERAEGCGVGDLPVPCASMVSWKQETLHPDPRPQLQKAGWVTLAVQVKCKPKRWSQVNSMNWKMARLRKFGTFLTSVMNIQLSHGLVRTHPKQKAR